MTSVIISPFHLKHLFTLLMPQLSFGKCYLQPHVYCVEATLTHGGDVTLRIICTLFVK